MEECKALKQQVLKSIEKVKKIIPGNVFVIDPLIDILCDLAKTIKQRPLGTFDVRQVEECYEAMVELKQNVNDYYNRGKISRVPQADLDYLIEFLRSELNKEFTPIELDSVNVAKHKLEQSDVHADIRKKIINALRDVHQTPYRHTRLDRLLALKNLCQNYDDNDEICAIKNTAHEMTKVILNASNDDELAEKLYVRSHLVKYKPDFVTMPPKESPQGNLLRDLLEFELTENGGKPEVIRNIGHKAFGFWKKSSVKLVPNNSQYAHFKSPRKVYLSLLVPYMLNAIAEGHIRPLNAHDSHKDLKRDKVEFTSEELEEMRLYPNSQAQMLLKLQHNGKGDNQSLRFYPYNTYKMEINDSIPYRGMIVMTPSGSLYTTSTTSKVVHSSLCHNAYFAGYGKFHYGRMSELGTISGNFRTTSQNAINFFKYIHQLKLVDHSLSPNFYLDNCHSQHLLQMAIKYHKARIFELINDFPMQKNEILDQKFLRLANLNLNRWALNILNFEQNTKQGFALPRKKIPLPKIFKDFPHIKEMFDDLAEQKESSQEYSKLKLHIENELIKLLRTRYNIHITDQIRANIVRNKESKKFFYKLLKRNPLHASKSRLYDVYHYPREFEKIMTETFKDHAHKAYIPHKHQPGYFPHEDLSDFFLDQTVYYRERMHQNGLNNQARPSSKMRDFFTAPTNINRAKSKKQKWLEDVLENKALGTLLSTLLLATYTTLCFAVFMDVFSLSLIAISLAASATLSLITNIEMSERDICVGYSTNIGAATFFFLIALLATPIAPSISMPAVFTTFALPLFGVLMGSIEIAIKLTLDHRTRKRCVDSSKYVCPKTSRVESKQQTNAHKAATDFFYEERDKRKEEREQAIFKHDSKQSTQPGSTTRYLKPETMAERCAKHQCGGDENESPKKSSARRALFI